MKKRQMERWVKALKSGKYEQGSEKLYNPETNAYCCLGVLTHINKQYLKDYESKDVYCGKTESLPDSIMAHTGIQESMGEYVCPEGFEDNLARLNDEGNLSFTEIADIIEQNYKRL